MARVMLKTRSLLSAAVVLTLGAQAAHATNYYLGATTANWSDPTKWSLDNTGAPLQSSGTGPVSGDTAYFNGTSVTGTTTVSLTADAFADGLVFRNAANMTLQGSTATRKLTLGAGGITTQTGAGTAILSGSLMTLDVGATTLNFNNVTAVTINSATTGSAGISKIGSGAATLNSASNNITGAINVNGGILQFGSSGGTGGSFGSGNITITSGTFVIGGGTNRTVSNLVSGAGAFYFSSSHVSSTVTNTGNSFSGGLRIAAGAVTAQSSPALTGANANIDGNAGLGNGDPTKSPTAIELGGTTLNLRVNGDGTSSVQKLTLFNSTTNGATPYTTGSTGATLGIGYSGSTGVSATINVAPVTGDTSTNKIIAFAGRQNLLRNGTLNVTGSAGYSLALGEVSLNAGNADADTFTFNPTTANLAIGNITSSSTTVANALILGGGNGSTNTVTGTIADAPSATKTTALTKTGNSTWTLSGNNGYAGGTTITGGTLLVTNSLGSATGSGMVTVTSGTLGGTGFITGAVNVAGTIAPGLSIAPLATGALTFNSGTFAAEIDSQSNSADRIDVAGDLNINGTSLLQLTDLGSGTLAPDTVLTLIDYSGTWNLGTFSGYADDSEFTFNGNAYRINYNDGTAVTLTVVPEPAALSLIGLLGAGLLRRRR